MDPKENPTETTQTDVPQLSTPVGDQAVSEPTAALTLEEINAITGKNYTSKESALKSIADMNSMAGKAANDIGKDEANAKRIEALEMEAFLARNPQHEANLDLLQTLAKANGVSVKEAADLPVYQSVLERTQVAGATVSKRTIAAPNSRVAQPAPVADVKDVLGDADASAQFVVDNILKI